ncbi:carbohydrate ABC transporter permease [Actinomadura sp. WMMA1423]|uniref:carbohydrate ABC transporter permease n=1 Tax=Actinomadura sp. WMMA1423 TaxID=2591108 RepID=UPI00114756BB|nr:carbohydrate ABC transporter permease [Actinomadura sp. WMMA1423]
MIEIRTRGGRIAAQVLATVALVPFIAPLAITFYRSTGGDGFVANYRAVIERPEFLHFFRNSLVIALGAVLLTWVCTMLASFALACLHVRGREVAFYLLVGALALPTAALTVPLSIAIRSLDLYDNPLAVVLPIAALGIAFSIFLARAFMAEIPDEILKAARVDGASTFGVFRHIILPMTRPISAVIIVWAFVGSWNEYLLPLLFLQETDKQTITLLPSYFVGQFGADLPKLYAATFLISLPTVACYAAFSRFFERGLLAGSLK